MKKNIRILLGLLLAAALFLSLCVGRYSIGPKEVLMLFLDRLGLPGYLPVPPSEMQMVFWNIRLPRILLGLVIGGGISIAGVVFQALFRNPLAAPDILGVTAGASFGAALAIMVLTQWTLGIQSSAFAFGIMAVFCAYVLASRSRDRSAAVLVISGIVISAIFQSGLSILMYIADPYDQLSKIIFWIMGSFHTASWSKVEITVPIVLIGSVTLGLFGWRLNIMTQNEEEAISLGIHVSRWRLFYITISTLIVASSVAAVGTISWVGLIIPHIARYLVGPEHKRLLPVAGLLGGIFVLLMDTAARTVLASEIPISIITSIIGAPFLGYLILNRKGVRI
ncbi:MAG: iron ABC transporter permease [Desulfobacteraceae bacterium]|nr:MAG: iron ABC transporter permease [Desulfobacteraceae bacterium]